jgi:broad specificity phosphatase PhoE
MGFAASSKTDATTCGGTRLSETLHPEELVTTLFLIRHGHTAQTEAGKLYSDPESVLTDKGRAEVNALAQILPAEKPELVLTSPSVRARATADVIAGMTKLNAEVVPQLHEWQVGEWEGRSYLEIKKAEPEVYAAWSKDPIRNAPPGGESIEQLCQRAQKHVAEITTKYGGKRILLVSHAEVIRAFLVYALGMPVDNFWRLSVPTASVCKVDFSAHFATLHYSGLRPDTIAALAH